MATVYQRGAGTSWATSKLRQDPLESHEVPRRGECGEFHFQIYSTSDWTFLSNSASVQRLCRCLSAEGAAHVFLFVL